MDWNRLALGIFRVQLDTTERVLHTLTERRVLHTLAKRQADLQAQLEQAERERKMWNQQALADGRRARWVAVERDRSYQECENLKVRLRRIATERGNAIERAEAAEHRARALEESARRARL